MKGAWKVRGTTFRFSMSWYARMLQKSAMWTLLKRNHNLFRQFSFVFFWEQVSSNDAFFQVIPTFFYRKPRLDVTCVVLYIERPERPSFRRRVSLTVYNFRIPSIDLHLFFFCRPITMRNTMVRRANAWKNQLESLPKHLEIV